MIDYLALTIGHALLAIALLRLFPRDGLDVDPVLERFAKDAREHRKSQRRRAKDAYGAEDEIQP